ncbi:Lecithin:cholesterol acyltransferase family protein [Tritrichomonas foetus]|uniref:Lecithin:cholesterol acyltransferase family protein n=1 Tax=Tritrichomonas foetus TaxID=1144522 RepID=A0A1J4J600_9EUKA|nr:Lecithin:cholesterol acyltransferase family protein [Tritrichomonas foetus]|eukprot:OHS94658.1 Lecithin:cholesterol acyltransferase family protein [Tritrichomonas foetus]
MFALFTLLSIANNPIILVPGAFRSGLSVSTTTQTHHPKCPQNLSFYPFWINARDFLPPRFKCIINWLTLDFDKKSNIITDQPNVTVNTIDFGGIEGIRGTGEKILGQKIPLYYETIIKILEKQNYTIGLDLFGSPYDWRYGVAQPDLFWKNLTHLIETAYEKNEHQKVKILTHSCGGIIIHKLLTDMTTLEWRQKYIHSVVMSAPSFSGSGQSLIALYRQRFPFIKFYKTKQMQEMVGSLGAFHVHLPNQVVFLNTTVFITPEGDEIKGNQVIDFLIKHKKLTKKQQKIAAKNFESTINFPKSLDVPVRILYNSGFDTAFGLKLKDWESEGETIYEKGDGIVMSKGIEMACEQWKLNGTDIECLDLKSNKFSTRHPFLILRSKSINILLNWLTGQTNEASQDKATTKSEHEL